MSRQQTIITHLQQSLDSFSEALESHDFSQLEGPACELGEFLSSISDPAIADSNDEEAINKAVLVLSHIHSYLSNASLDQAVIDALSFELPKFVAKFAGVSRSCRDLVDSVIDLFISKCHPRDMISVFCEALHLYGETTDAPGYVAALLHGLSKVFLSIQRRHFEQIKVAVPVILNALKTASFDDDDRDLGLKDLFEEAINIANSMQATCKKLDGGANERLRALLGACVLQTMTVLSVSMGNNISNCCYLIKQLSSFFPYCGLSFADLVTGQGVDAFIGPLFTDDADDLKDCFPYVQHGAVLSVIWGHISDEVAQTAGQDFSTLRDELSSSQSRRLSAIGMLKFIFSLDELPWTIKEHTVSFLLSITENLEEPEINGDICSFNTPSVISTLQAIVSIIMSAPDAELRKNALVALKRVLAVNPAALRLDIMQVLVRTSTSSSMTAILLDCARENLRNDYCKLQKSSVSIDSSFWSVGILDLMEFVLKAPSRGPPSLPEQCDAILSALNLYRYVLISESTGKTNYTGVMSRNKLQEVYNEWLLPLRVLVSAIIAENKNEYDQLAMDFICGLNPVEYVLYRCIELIEEKLKQLS